MKFLITFLFSLLTLSTTAQINVVRGNLAPITAMVLNQNIFWEGNSLSSYSVNSGADTYTLNQFYIPMNTYNNIRTGHRVGIYNLSISGRNQTQINADIATKIAPWIKTNDICVVWEGTNDMYTNGLSGADAFANLMTYVNTVHEYGAKVVVCTVIARDYVLDAPDLMDRVDAYNALVRANASSFECIADLGADSRFDTRADASNGIYYNADKIHQSAVGQDVVFALITTAINAANILN